MTALVADTVQRTFSAVGNYWTGLPGAQSDQAGGEDFADLGDALAGIIRLQ